MVRLNAIGLWVFPFAPRCFFADFGRAHPGASGQIPMGMGIFPGDVRNLTDFGENSIYRIGAKLGQSMEVEMGADYTEKLLRLQTETLEAVARGEPLAEIGRIICMRAQHYAPEVICSILQLDDKGRLHPLATPGLPESFSRQIEGLAIGPEVGSCGTAAYRNEPVIVTDIATDPLWANYRQLAEPWGIRACWSSPIRDREGRVLGTFAFYYHEARGPSEFEQQIVATAVHLCALALEHERIIERNRRLAYFDVLTGLPNRGRFNQLLSEAITADAPFGLILLDIDHLKRVNDGIGHAAGDSLIRTVANRLSQVGPDIIPCRLGGDEFAVLVQDCADHAQLEEIAGRIQAAARGMVTLDGQSFEAHVTLGGAVFPRDGANAETLCQNADFALYHAKQSYRGAYMGFRPDLRTEMIQRIDLVRQLDQAMLEGRVEAHYQPLVRLDTTEIVGVEALARLRMPDGRIATAQQFHSALSDPRIAYELTGCMLEQVARDVRRWLDADIEFQHAGINVTTGDFQRGDLAERIMAIFGRHNVPLRHVVLEVNEAVFMGGADNQVPRAVEALREQGLLVALDDFGTGFASLTHLLSFPVDIIKIDRSFVSRIGSDQPSQIVVSAMIDIARKLGMRVIAEGVETAEQADILRALGCVLGQGYLYSRPVAAVDATDLLARFGQRLRPPSPRLPKRLLA